MKVTLIYVGIGVAGFNPDRCIGDREGSWIGHGIASIGACVRADGYPVTLIDMRQLSGFDHLANVINKNPSDVYGLSVSPVDYYPALKTAHIIKIVSPDSKVIVGGIHPSIFPEKYGLDIIDSVVVGEGEIAFLDLLAMIKNGDVPPKIMTGQRPSLDAIPWVDRELFDYQRELSCWFADNQQTPSITMLAGRGCPYHCAYCQPAENAVFGHPCRMRSVEDVVLELKWLKLKYDYKSITFWDDTFTFNAKWIEQFCDLYERSKIGAPIVACSRADIICKNESMIERLAGVGVDWLVIGFESGSQRLLDFIRKGTTVEQNYDAAGICRKYGIKVFGTYMYGLPTETEEESTATATMIKEIDPERPSPFWFTPINGTELHKYCEERDLILDKHRTIARTGMWIPSLKGINYDHIRRLMEGTYETVSEASPVVS